jgi:hypothetical protein
MKSMKLSVSGDVPRPLVGGMPDSDNGDEIVLERQLSAIAFGLLKVEQRRTLPATDKKGTP